MPRGARIVDQQNIVQDVEHLFIAYQGQSMEVGTGFVASGGIVRQFWPRSADASDPSVGFTSDPETASAAGELPVTTKVYIDINTGELVLSTYNTVTFNNETRSVPCLTPVPRGTGYWLVRAEVLTGTITNPIAAWTDAYANGNLSTIDFEMVNSTGGQVVGTMRLDVALDDGAGQPISGSIVSKVITFTADEITDRISMTETPWNLDNEEINELAEVWIVTIPDNWFDPNLNATVEFPAINGEFGFPKGIQITEVYTKSWKPEITVQLDQVSGDPITSPDGLELGVPYSTELRRRWRIFADQPDTEQNAVVDVTITDGNESRTKRVTMRAAQVSETTPEVPDDEFTRYDEIKAYDYSSVITEILEAEAFLYVNPDGTVDASTIPSSSLPNFPQKWIDGTPTRPQDFECRVVFQTTSNNVDFRGIENVWQNCSEERQWSVRQTFSNSPQTVDITAYALVWLEIREVGRPETVLTKEVRLEARVKKP